jgi:hypothetical protein
MSASFLSRGFVSKQQTDRGLQHCGTRHGGLGASCHVNAFTDSFSMNKGGIPRDLIGILVEKAALYEKWSISRKLN